MLAYSPTPSTLSTPRSQPMSLYPEQRHQRTNSSPTSPLRKAISLSFFRGDRKRESAPVASTSASTIMAAAAPVARRARRSMSMTRKRSKGSLLPDMPAPVDEEGSTSSCYSSSPVQQPQLSGSPTVAAATLPFAQARTVKTFSQRVQRRLSLVMSTAPDWSEQPMPSSSSGTSSAPPSRRPSTATSYAAASSTTIAAASSPLRRKGSLQGSFMPTSWTNTIHSSSPSSDAGSRPRSRLTRKVSEESFRCRGLESDDEADDTTFKALFASYNEAGVHVTQNDVTMLGQAEDKENVYRHEADDSMMHDADDDDFGITTPRARILTPAALRMNDFTLSAFSDAPAPSALSLRRRVSPKSNISPPLAPLNLNALQAGIPSRPIERPGSLYYISPAPSSIASFSAGGHDDDEDDDALSIADSESSRPASTWSAACPPTPPSAIRLQLRFFGALPGVEAPMDLSTGEQLTPPVGAVFVQSGASTLELKELVVEQLISRGVSLTPRDLILSSSTTLATSEDCTASALGLAFSSSPPMASPRSPTFKTLLGRELLNDRLLYEQGLLEDDTVSVRVRPAYAQNFF